MTRQVYTMGGASVDCSRMLGHVLAVVFGRVPRQSSGQVQLAFHVGGFAVQLGNKHGLQNAAIQQPRCEPEAAQLRAADVGFFRRHWVM